MNKTSTIDKNPLANAKDLEFEIHRSRKIYMHQEQQARSLATELEASLCWRKSTARRKGAQHSEEQPAAVATRKPAYSSGAQCKDNKNNNVNTIKRMWNLS